MGETQSATRPGTRKVANIALWALQVLLALAFIVPVYRKLAGVTESVQLFDDIGFGQWLRYAVGMLELTLAIGLIIPRFAGLAALGLVGVLAGAIATELFFETGRWVPPLVLLIISAIVAWGRRDRITRLLRPNTLP